MLWSLFFLSNGNIPFISSETLSSSSSLLSSSLFSSTTTPSSPFWPQPSSFSLETATEEINQMILDQNFQFLYSEESTFLKQATTRYLSLLSPQTVGNLKSCTVNVVELNENEYVTLQLNVNESYTLSISNDFQCEINSQTVWGAIHAFETFSQLFIREINGPVYSLYNPVSVSDDSRFSHRGILIDTSRHYLPVDYLKRFIDTLPMNKFNVLHWHMVDAQSFPVDTPSAPRMVHGAFTPAHVYTMDDIQHITTYAADRGIRILPEIDIPGHAASWTKGYPTIMAKCFRKYSYNINDFALDPTQSETYNVVDKVLSDLISTMNVEHFHLGGDEVVYGCWKNDTNIVNFMAEQGWSSYDQLLEYFVLKVDGITRSHGSTPIHWEEVFKAGAKVDSDVIFEVWTSQDQIRSVVQKNYRVIAAPSDVWYLDHAENTWKVMYAYDPLVNLTSTESSFIIGGEVAMWGEHVDENNLEGIVYPRASSVSERLWSPATTTNQDDALARLTIHRCRMISRGIKPGAVEPGYCSLTTVPV